MKYKKNENVILRILVSMLVATGLLYSLIGFAKLFGSSYDITDGEYFITWVLLSILTLLSINNFYKK